MPANSIIIAQTKKWISDVVVGNNFCPFAAREMKRGTVHYAVARSGINHKRLHFLTNAFRQLDSDASIETTLLIFPVSFKTFHAYLHLLANGERLLEKSGNAGVYQLASFHPAYLFEGAADDDAANYTNRSPYPMLHILREASLTLAIDSHPDTAAIPGRNIKYARKKGLVQMQLLREACF
ncbi:MAG: DUF1415 domain-containing protein [Chitinophagales bacterium]|nr:DUF1415 domain-containing protein [Chitinophagales bacterium]